jgi:ELWxxDGT repeat protein
MAQSSISSYPRGISVVDGEDIYLTATIHETGNSLLHRSPTSGLVNLTGDWSHPISFTAADGEAYFFASDGAVVSRDLWRTDGTPAGTSLAADIDAEDDGIVEAAWAAGRLFFENIEPTTGHELWSFDGVSASITRDASPGILGSYPVSLIAAGDRVYFAGGDLANGKEGWVSDGTALGTKLIADISVGPDWGIPNDFHLAGGELFFFARALDFDMELYRLEIVDAHVLNLGHSESGASLSATPPTLGGSVTATI